MTTHDYNKIAAIVGEDKIDALRDAGVDISDKPTQPTTGLLGRWAKHAEYGDALIASDKVDDGCVSITVRDEFDRHGAVYDYVAIAELTFPEQTTRPEDVPVGEAWLVDAHNGYSDQPNTPALKIADNLWTTHRQEEIDDPEWYNDPEVTLITPLVPLRPQDREPETVTTQEEYDALPVGSIVARDVGDPYTKVARSKWKSINGSTRTNCAMEGETCRVLRRGWGESHTAHHAEQAGQSNGNV